MTQIQATVGGVRGTRVERGLRSAMGALALWLISAPALADVSRAVDYPCQQVWTATQRLLRVDLGFVVDEKDRDAGYVLFRYANDGRTHPGSFELACAAPSQRGSVQIRVRVKAMPRYVEEMLVEKLARKLVADFGLPERDTRKRKSTDRRRSLTAAPNRRPRGRSERQAERRGKQRAGRRMR